MAFPAARNQIYVPSTYVGMPSSITAPAPSGPTFTSAVGGRTLATAAQPPYMPQVRPSSVCAPAAGQRPMRPSIVSVGTVAQPPIQKATVPAPMTSPGTTTAKYMPSSYKQVEEQNTTLMYGSTMQEDEWDRQVTDYAHGIRTAQDNSIPAKRALEKLQEGNQRFMEGTPAKKTFTVNSRSALATYGQRPMVTIIGCADSRCSPDIMFDAHPGDLFVLRNAGNTLTHAEGSMVGSAEYSVCNLGTHLILVLGHTKCGAIAGATKCMLDRKAGKMEQSAEVSALTSLLADLEPVAAQAQLELQGEAMAEDISAYAVYVNVFNSVEKLLAYSEPLREKCREGKLEIHGAVYDIVSGRVEFLGQHPRLPLLLGSHSGLLHRPTPKA